MNIATRYAVIPAKAGIQGFPVKAEALGPRLRGDDEEGAQA